jgi:hypothetical protein
LRWDIANSEFIATMHEEYLPGYDWEDLIERDIEKDIPLDDKDDLTADPPPPRKRKEWDEE